MNTAEGDKAANVTLDVDQLEANGNRHDIPIMSLQKISRSKKLMIGLSYFGCECNDSDDANIAQYFKVLLHTYQFYQKRKQILFLAYPP